MEEEVKALDDNVAKIRAILSSVDDRSLSLKEQQVIVRCPRSLTLSLRDRWNRVSHVLLFHGEGHSNQHGVHTEVAGGGGELQRGASPPSGSRGEPADLLQSSAAAPGAGAAQRADVHAAAGTGSEEPSRNTDSDV